MELNKGILFDKRYLLVKPLGEGASSQVWLANDTLAANLRVAVKILSTKAGIDTLGLQNFQHEFTNVFNLQHQNLLTPTNYSLSGDTPYLILPYCENGSVETMAGRCSEGDILHILHDVAAALEHLHAHNIIHQDIKPANILVDDDCNYLVTDFGISTDKMSSHTKGYGGTRAYMGPERFERDSTPIFMNDIWALGASVCELINGEPPFGEEGGVAQSIDLSFPVLDKSFSPELRKLILQCLDPEPWRRPSARQIKELTALRLKTGSWKERNPKNVYMYVAVAAAVFFLLSGLLLWNYHRTKIYYYKDYCEVYGVPDGISQLTGSEQQHRMHSYRMEYSKGKLRRMTLVNSEGNPVPHNDTETMHDRYTDVRYYYTDDGKIDYKIISDQSGNVLYKMDYDESLSTVTFKQNDQYGTEMYLKANTTALLNQNENDDAKSHISRYLLSWDKEGRLSQVLYAGLMNVPAFDSNNIHGIRYSYDSKGRKTEEQFLGIDGEPTSNGIGLSIKRFAYDEYDNWIEVRYLNQEGKASHDGNNSPLVEIEYDKYGNRTAEYYYTLDHKPSLRTDFGVFGFKYTIDESGHMTSQTCVGKDHQPYYCNQGFVSLTFTYDEHGFVNSQSYYDIKKRRTNNIDNGIQYSRIKSVNNQYGLHTSLTFFDVYDKPLEVNNKYHEERVEYDSLGNVVAYSYYTSDGKRALRDGLYHKIINEYDQGNRLVKAEYYGVSDSLTSVDNGVCVIRWCYGLTGELEKVSFFDEHNKPHCCKDGNASKRYEYDSSNGNLKTIEFLNQNDQLARMSDGIARQEFDYDKVTNKVNRRRDYDMSGNLVEITLFEYDRRGNVTKMSELSASGALKSGTVVVNAEYDKNNKIEKIWYSNLKKAPVPAPGTSTYSIKRKYDDVGNLTEESYLGVGGGLVPQTDDTGLSYARKASKYNDYGNETEVKYYDSSNRLFRSDTYAYNDRNRAVEHVIFDGKGREDDSFAGFSRQTIIYDKEGLIIQRMEFFDSSKRRLGYRIYDEGTKEWGDFVASSKE